MDWIVENGTGLDNANCYMDADGVRAYALNRGIVLPAVDGDNDPIAAWMVLAMDYLASLEYEFWQATEGQALAWPRKRHRFDTHFLLPSQIQSAMAQLVIEQNNGIQLFASAGGFNQNGGFVTMEKVDVLETRYSEKVIPAGPDMPSVNALLRNLIVPGGTLRSVRI